MKCETLIEYLTNATGRVHIFTYHERILSLYFDDDKVSYTIREGYCGDSSSIHVIELHKSGTRYEYLIDAEKVSYVIVSNKSDR